MKIIKLPRLVIFVIVSVLLTGCPSTTLSLKPGTTAGKVFISDPKVSTRERLVNDRYQQDAWLRKELAEAENKQFGFEGAMERRSFQAIMSKTGIQADPTKLKLYNLKQENDIQILKNKLENLKNDDILNQIKFEKAKKALADDGSSAIPSNEEIQSLNEQIVALQAQIKDLESRVAASGNNNLDIPGKPTDNSNSLMELTADKVIELGKKVHALTTDENPKIVDDAISPSPINEFRDKMAYRNEIRTEIAKNGLDERHDYAGNTLYSLGFDVSVLPGNDTGAWAVVEVEVNKPTMGEIMKIIDDDYDSFLVSLEKDINQRFYAKSQVFDCLNFDEGDVGKIVNIVDKCFDNIPDHLKTSLILDINDTLNSRVVKNQIEKKSGDGGTPKTNALWHAMEKSIKSLSTENTNSLKDQSTQIKESISHKYSLASKLLKLIESCKVGTSSKDVNTKKNWSLQQYCSSLKSSLSKNENDTINLQTIHKAAIFALRNYSIKVEDPALNKFGLEIELINPANKFDLSDPYLYISPIGKNAKDLYEINTKEELKKTLIKKINLAISEKLKDNDLYAYAVTPTETVQRISDVASRQELSDLMVSINALASGAAGIEQYLNILNSNQGVYNAIRRQPLVVGFSDRQTSSEKIKFGWILGPKFTTSNDGKSAQFRHSAMQNSLTAQVSVPAWWPKLKVTTSYKWIDEQGNELATKNNSLNVGRSATLPSNLLDLTANLVAFANDPRPRPEKQDFRRYVVGQPGAFVIKGENLWRSTVVTLAGQKADRIEVLPSMRGIIAYFDKLNPLLDTEDVYLKVWTSDGDAVAGKVSVSNISQAEPAKELIEATSNYAISGNEIQFRVSDNLFKKIDGATFEVTTSKVGPWASCSGFTRTHNGFAVNLPNKEAFKTNKLSVSNGDLLYFRVVTFDKQLLQPTNQPILYLADSDKQLKVTVKKLTTDNNQYDLEIQFPKKFELAFPSSIKDRISKTVWINIDNDKLKLVGACNVTSKQNACKLKLKNNDTSNDQKFTISATDDLKSSELTLTGLPGIQ